MHLLPHVHETGHLMLSLNLAYARWLGSDRNYTPQQSQSPCDRKRRGKYLMLDQQLIDGSIIFIEHTSNFEYHSD